MAKALKQVVKTKDKNGNDLELAVITPSSQVKQRARLIYAKAWRDAIEAGAMMREALDTYLRQQKLWDDARQAEYDRIRKTLLEGERKLRTGGIRKTEAKDIALGMRRLRDELGDLLTQRNRVDANTADAQADQMQFNWYVAACTVYNDSGKFYFSKNNGHECDLDDYIERASEQASQDAANKVAEVLYGADTDSQAKLPENEFLRTYGFADEKGRLVNAEGKLVDEKGRLINEEGRFINEAGEYVDADGNRVDEDGKYLVEFSPFLDDDGTPIVLKTEVEPDSESPVGDN